MYKTIRRSGVFLLAVLLVMWLMAGFGFSSASAEGQGRITIICRTNDKTLAGMKWSIYKVGVRESDTSFAAEGDFRSYYVRINDFSSEHLSDMASTLENMAILDRLPAIDSSSADEDGKLTFSELEPGLYLLSGKTLYSGMYTYKPSPILVEVKENSAEYIQINAKIRQLLTLNGEVTPYTVKKIWNDQENKYGNRPDKVTVEIYKDGELYKTVELNESNNWTYTWSYQADNSDWRVKESAVPYRYTVIYRSDDTQYAIVNTFDEDGSNTVTTTTTAINTTIATTTTSANTVTATNTVTDNSNATTSNSTYETTADSHENTNTTINTETTSTESVRTTVLTPVTTVGSKLPQTSKFGGAIPILAFGGLAFTAISLRKKDE